MPAYGRFEDDFAGNASQLLQWIVQEIKQNLSQVESELEPGLYHKFDSEMPLEHALSSGGGGGDGGGGSAWEWTTEGAAAECLTIINTGDGAGSRGAGVVKKTSEREGDYHLAHGPELTGGLHTWKIHVINHRQSPFN